MAVTGSEVVAAPASREDLPGVLCIVYQYISSVG